MNIINVNGKAGEYVLHLPESLKEISKEYLEDCTKFINPAPNYALVAVVYKDNFFSLLSAITKKKATNVSVIPLFIKCGTTDCDFINSINLGDKIVVSGSDLSLGHHIDSPNNDLTPYKIVNYCDGDTKVHSDAITMKNSIYLVEFKLVPVNAIHGKLDEVKLVSSRYVVAAKNVN